jgi:hypothetical protein
MGNENEVVAVLKKGNMMRLNVVDTATMSYYEQLKVKCCFIFTCPPTPVLFIPFIFHALYSQLVRSTNVLVGIHGAGLMFIMFAAEEVSAQCRSYFVCNYISRIITLCYKYNIFHAFSCLV